MGLLEFQNPRRNFLSQLRTHAVNDRHGDPEGDDGNEEQQGECPKRDDEQPNEEPDDLCGCYDFHKRSVYWYRVKVTIFFIQGISSFHFRINSIWCFILSDS